MSAGRERAKATFWLLEASDSLSRQSRREPDGTGLGWFDGRGRAQLSKQPIAAYEDREFARRAHEVCSTTFVAHVRFASTGGLELRNTHPFEQAGRLFAHNGVVHGLDRLDEHLGDDRALVHGDTDSERLFALITREIAAHGGDVELGVETACRWVAANLPVFALNLVLVEEGALWALRYPETHELHVLERAPGGRLQHTSSLGSRVTSTDGHKRPLVTVASERLDGDRGWRELKAGELLRVGPDLQVSARRVLDRAPAKPLTLADLDAHARASQATVG